MNICLCLGYLGKQTLITHRVLLGLNKEDLYVPVLAESLDLH